MVGYRDIQIKNALMDCHVFWARVVSSENETLFTKYTKHTFYEIQYALDGHMGMMINQEHYIKIDKSTFMIVPPDTYHQIVDATDVGARFVMALSIDFKDKKMCRDFDSLLLHGETPCMREILDIISAKDYQQSSVSRRQIAALLESFILEVCEIIATNATLAVQDGIAGKSALAKEMQAFVKSTCGIGVQVKDIAKKFNVTERHVNRIFKEATGECPKEYINREKLKKIEEYMISTSLTLSEISVLCGFCDEYAMNKFFKRYNFTNISEFKTYAHKNKKIPQN